jgi:protein subunit release factor A
MLDKLANIEKKYLDLREQSMNPEIISDQKKSIQINKEISNMQEIYELIQECRKYEAQVTGAKEII